MTEEKEKAFTAMMSVHLNSQIEMSYIQLVQYLRIVQRDYELKERKTGVYEVLNEISVPKSMHAGLIQLAENPNQEYEVKSIVS